MDEGLSHLIGRMDERFDRVDAETKHRFDAVDERFNQADREMKAEFKRVDQRFEQVDQRFEQVDQRFGLLEASMKEGLGRVDKEMGEIRVGMKDLHADNKATQRVMVQGFIAICTVIVAGFVATAGAVAL